jgi:hypothetical protein
MMPCVGADMVSSDVGTAMSVGWGEGGVGEWFLKVGVDKKDEVEARERRERVCESLCER